jgi:DNA-binding transcriptional MerR regulator
MGLRTGQSKHSANSAQKGLASAAEIPDRLYFRIGDVAKICSVEPYVLRFWETQFPALKPNKGGTGQRLYRRREVELALHIKQLVHHEGYTLAGARQALDAAPRNKAKLAVTGVGAVAPAVEVSPSSQQRLDGAAATIGQVRAELRELVRQLGEEQPVIIRKRSRVTAFKPAADSLFDPLFPV